MNLARSGRPPPLNLDKIFRNKLVHGSITYTKRTLKKYIIGKALVDRYGLFSCY